MTEELSITRMTANKTKSYKFNRKYVIRILEREEWSLPAEHRIIFYTEGSVIHHSVGAVLYCANTRSARSIPLRRNEIRDSLAKVAAL